MGVFFVFPLDEMDDGRHPLSFAVSLLFFVTFLYSTQIATSSRLEKIMVVFVALRAARKKKKTKTTKEEEEEEEEEDER